MIIPYKITMEFILIKKISCIPSGSSVVVVVVVVISMVVGADVAVVDVVLVDVDGTLVVGLTVVVVDNLISGLQALLHKASVKNLNSTHITDRK